MTISEAGRKVTSPRQIQVHIKRLNYVPSRKSINPISRKRRISLTFLAACVLVILLGAAIALPIMLQHIGNAPDITTINGSTVAVKVSASLTTMITSTTGTSSTSSSSSTSTSTSSTSTSSSSTSSTTSTTDTTSTTSSSSTSTSTTTSTTSTSSSSSTSTSTSTTTSTTSTSSSSSASTSTSTIPSTTSTSSSSSTSTTTTTSTTSTSSSSSTSTTSTTSTTTTSTTTAIPLVVALNQPTLCPNASWDANGITLANSSTVGIYPFALFVDNNNAVYVAETNLNRTQMFSAGSSSPTRNITGGFSAPHAVSVTINGDVYVDNGVNGEVDKWTLNATSGVKVMTVSGRCLGLFVDTNNTLYCSMDSYHKVSALRFNSSTNILVAGTGAAGSTPNKLNYPNGVVVDLNFSLYVADYGNNRIQKFLYGQSNATTVAGNGSAGTITLNGPTGVAVDANQYLFIADYANARIVGSGPYGFRCVVGCSGSSGSSSSQLHDRKILVSIVTVTYMLPIQATIGFRSSF